MPRLLAALTLFLFLTLSLVFYYLTHKPITPAQALALGQSLLNIAIVFLLTLLAGGLGRWALQKIFKHTAHNAQAEPAELFLALALGWGALSLSVWVLGMVGQIHTWTLWAICLLLGFALRVHLWAWLKNLFFTLQHWALGDFLTRWAFALLTLTLALSLLRALAPPWAWDALVYHLTLPKLYLQTHGFALPPHTFSVFNGMPQLSETLYTFAWGLRASATESPIAAQTLGWAFGATLLLGLTTSPLLRCSSASSLPRPLSPIPPAILLSSLSFSLYLAYAYSDLLQAVMTLAMLYALHYWAHPEHPGRAGHPEHPELVAGRRAAHPAEGQNRNRWLILAALFAGFAWGGKYTGAVVPFGGAAVILMTLWPTKNWARLVRDVALFGAITLLAFSPWLIKNLIFIGSPIYPVLWPSGDMDALRLQFYTRPDWRDANPVWTALIFFRATFLGQQGVNEYDITLGPLFTLLGLVFIFIWFTLTAEQRGRLRPLLAFLAASYLGWVAFATFSHLGWQARIFASLFPALALLGAYALQALPKLDTPQLRLSRVIPGLVALVLSLGAFENLVNFVNRNPLPYLFGEQSALTYRQSQLGAYTYALEAIAALPPSSRVKFLWEPRSLECQPAERCDPDVIIDRWWHARRTLGDPAAIQAQWQAQGFTHVLIYDQGVAFIQNDPHSTLFAPEDWHALATWRSTLPLVTQIGEAYSLYALAPP